MFYRQKHYPHMHGFLYVLSLIAAFMLGRKSERYGYTIVSQGCCSQADDDSDMMNEPAQNNDYPQ